MTDDEIDTYARETRAATRTAQGLTPDLTDPVSLDRIAVIVDTDPLPVRKAAS